MTVIQNVKNCGIKDKALFRVQRTVSFKCHYLCIYTCAVRTCAIGIHVVYKNGIKNKISESFCWIGCIYTKFSNIVYYLWACVSEVNSSASDASMEPLIVYIKKKRVDTKTFKRVRRIIQKHTPMLFIIKVHLFKKERRTNIENMLSFVFGGGVFVYEKKRIPSVRPRDS